VQDVLFSDAVERAVVVEAKVARVYNVVGLCLCGEVVKRLQIACRVSVSHGAGLSFLAGPYLSHRQCRELSHCPAVSRALGWAGAARRRAQDLRELRRWACSFLDTGAAGWELAGQG
jgi:hypothetical protein